VLVLKCPVFLYNCKQKRVEKEDIKEEKKEMEEKEGLVVHKLL